MTDSLERAVARVRELPPARQDEIAELLFILAEQAPDTYEFSDEQLARIRAGLAEANAENFLDDDEVAALFRRSPR